MLSRVHIWVWLSRRPTSKHLQLLCFIQMILLILDGIMTKRQDHHLIQTSKEDQEPRQGPVTLVHSHLQSPKDNFWSLLWWDLSVSCFSRIFLSMCCKVQDDLYRMLSMNEKSVSPKEFSGTFDCFFPKKRKHCLKGVRIAVIFQLFLMESISLLLLLEVSFILCSSIYWSMHC